MTVPLLSHTPRGRLLAHSQLEILSHVAQRNRVNHHPTRYRIACAVSGSPGHTYRAIHKLIDLGLLIDQTAIGTLSNPMRPARLVVTDAGLAEIAYWNDNPNLKGYRP